MERQVNDAMKEDVEGTGNEWKMQKAEKSAGRRPAVVAPEGISREAKKS